ncbi:alpha/beta hydrolase [Urechidicola croceus]|uniref:alpha/beta hydrolase n=1 Tax=Urechidicola croceus TaxID=1850246 RepID=UPI001E5237B4|nr:alpha/beta hydrolase [Urechidicola croceus]
MIIVLVFLANSYAQTIDKLYLWPEEVPNEKGIKHNPIQIPDTSRNVIRITNITNPLLTVFKPVDSLKNGASIIISPGGGYKYLAINIEGYEIAEWFISLGYTAFVLEYRTPDNRIGALNDIQRAIRVVRSNSKKWNLDSEKIGVIGFSAGGHLSALVSTNFKINSYSKVDEIDKVSSRPDFSLLIYPFSLDQGVDNTLSPDFKIHNNIPPTFIFGTSDDTYANSFNVFASALQKESIPLEFHLYPNGGHGYGLRKGNHAAETWPLLAEKWLVETVF